jgi:hypothetical protein
MARLKQKPERHKYTFMVQVESELLLGGAAFVIQQRLQPSPQDEEENPTTARVLKITDGGTASRPIRWE